MTSNPNRRKNHTFGIAITNVSCLVSVQRKKLNNWQYLVSKRNGQRPKKETCEAGEQKAVVL